MDEVKTYSLDEIERELQHGNFPFRGRTELGTASFQFLCPAYYAALAIHAGSRVRSDLLKYMAVGKKDRFREEDPHTERLIAGFPIQVVAHDSRFEYDINRERERAIYPANKNDWGLLVWKKELTARQKNLTLAKYDEFHSFTDILADFLIRQNTYGVLLDCHSFNYQRDHRKPWFADGKPEINIGTKAVNRSVFKDIIDLFIERLSRIRIEDHHLRVGENEIFMGGYISRKYSKEHNRRLLVLAIEFKKIFMDEWTGSLSDEILQDLSNQFDKASQDILNAGKSAA
jgi:N-formylglutamate amidohydrolase